MIITLTGADFSANCINGAFFYLVESKTGAYIDSTLKDASMASYNYEKYAVSPGGKIAIVCKIGSGARCAWVDASGTRTQALAGNSNSGVNVYSILTVPNNAVYLEVCYSTTETQHDVRRIKTNPELVSTTTGYYLAASNFALTENSGFNIARYAITSGTKLRIKGRVGPASTCCAWIDSTGVKTVAVTGNSNSGSNVDTTLTIPTNTNFIDVTYGTAVGIEVSIVS